MVIFIIYYDAMKNLYLILRKDSDKTIFDLLKKSAEERGIYVKAIYTEDFDFTENITLTKNDALYRISTDKQSSLIENFLINESVNSFYYSLKDRVRGVGIGAILIHKKNNLPINKTIFSLTDDKTLLKKYAYELGGFPIIIKSLGGQHGVGVMKVDSLESLYSVSDYLCEQKDNFILRQFIDYKVHARLTVLGHKVISSLGYKRVESDFRTNAVDNPNIVSKKFDSNIEDIAVKAISVLGYEFGGVDILIDKDGSLYITEVNFPCRWVQQYSSIDISGRMIDFLINKSKAKIASYH